MRATKCENTRRNNGQTTTKQYTVKPKKIRMRTKQQQKKNGLLLFSIMLSVIFACLAASIAEAATTISYGYGLA